MSLIPPVFLLPRQIKMSAANHKKCKKKQHFWSSNAHSVWRSVNLRNKVTSISCQSLSNSSNLGPLKAWTLKVLHLTFYLKTGRQRFRVKAERETWASLTSCVRPLTPVSLIFIQLFMWTLVHSEATLHLSCLTVCFKQLLKMISTFPSFFALELFHLTAPRETSLAP